MKLKIMLSIVAILLLSVISVAAFDVDLTENELSGMPGDDVTFVFTVTNNDTENLSVEYEEFTLDFEGNSIEIEEGSLVIPGTEFKDLKIELTIPVLPFGDYEGTLTLKEDNSSNEEDINLTLKIKKQVKYELSTDNVLFSVTPESSENFTLEITNTGSVSLENIELVYNNDENEDFGDNVHEDSYGDKLVFTYPGLDILGSIEPGKKETLTLNVEADNFEVGNYLGKITLSVNENESDDKIIEVETEVWPQICRYGEVGNDLRVDVKEPRNRDNFKPGEEMEIEVVVDNRGYDRLYVVVEAILYDWENDKELEKVTKTEKINDNEDEDFELTLTVPTDGWDESGTYYLYVKAYEEDEEDEQCIFEKVEIELERDRDDIIVSEFTITPETVKAGDKILLFAEVQNIGTYDHEDVYVTFKNSALGLDIDSNNFDLEAYDDTDNIEVFETYFELPKDVVAQNYYVEAIVTFDDGDMISSELFELVVEGSEVEDEQDAVKGLELEVSESIDLAKGQTKFTLPFILKYEGDSAIEFTVDITDVSSWLNVLKIEAPSKLNPGDKFHSYAYLELKEDVASGPHNLRVNVRPKDGGLIDSKLLTIEVQDTVSVEESEVDDSKFKDFFTDKTNMFWLVGDLVLIVIGIFFIRMLFKKH